VAGSEYRFAPDGNCRPFSDSGAAKAASDTHERNNRRVQAQPDG